MDVFLAVLFLTWLIKTAVSDVTYAVRGQIPPRVAVKMARIEQAGGTVTRPARYGLRDLARDLWHDGIEDWRDERAGKRAAKAAARQAGTTTDELDESAGPAGGIPAAPGLHTRPAGPARVRPVPDPRPSADPDPPAARPTEATDRPTPGDLPTADDRDPADSDSPGHPGDGPDQPGPAAAPPEPEAAEPEPVNAPASPGPLRDAAVPGGATAAAPAATDAEPAPYTQTPYLPLAAEAFDGPDTPPTAGTSPADQGETMTATTTASAETTDMQATLAFLSELGAHIEQEILAKVELAQATLNGKNVDSETLAYLSKIREQGQVMASLCGQGAGHVTSYHGLMNQAVNSTPEAADTDWYRNH